jgi:D-serine deaminase-like pyridoxal phosphate-dependent protein
MKQANQEHGVLEIRAGSDARIPDLPVGSLVRILPNHACATSAQHTHYNVLQANQVVAQWPRIPSGW